MEIADHGLSFLKFNVNNECYRQHQSDRFHSDLAPQTGLNIAVGSSAYGRDGS